MFRSVVVKCVTSFIILGFCAVACSDNKNNTPAPEPTITSFSPTSGAPGASVVIKGTNFKASGSIVTFNGTTASITASSTTEITAIVPAAATTGKISVDVGSAIVTSSGVFTVL